MCVNVTCYPMFTCSTPSANVVLAALRLALNEVLRIEPGGLLLMAPDCRSFSIMYLW